MIRSVALADYAPPAAGPDHGVLRLDIGLAVRWLGLAAAGVIAASLAGSLSLVHLGLTRQDVPELREQVPMMLKLLLKFDAGGEQTVTAWLSSTILLLCATVLLHIARAERRGGGVDAWHWLGLAIIFCGLSIDEAVGLHEMTINPVREAFGASGMFRYAWVIPAMMFVALVGLACLGFLLRLEAIFRRRFLVAAALFVGGAVGFEMMEGALATFYSQHQLIYEAAVNLEDALEFAGELVFLHSLLLYARGSARWIRIRLA
jgi:hypothetical protein